MSDIILRGLLLPDTQYVSGTQGVKNKQATANVEQENRTVNSLALLDSLTLSDIGDTSSRGSIPIQLIAPDEVDNTPKQLTQPKNIQSASSILDQLMLQDDDVKPAKKQGSSNPILSGLKPSKVTNRTTTQSTREYNLPDLNISVTSTATKGYVKNSDGTQKIFQNYSIGATVTANDITSQKLNTAIEKIKNWRMKVGALNSELAKQQSSATSDPNVIITRSSQLAKAKKDAVQSRDEAIIAYNDALKEVKANFNGLQSLKVQSYKSSYDQMENLFAQVSEEHKGTMTKVVDYLKEVMTADNFQKALNFINPFADKY